MSLIVALWYYPTIMVVSGLSMIVFEKGFIQRSYRHLKHVWTKPKKQDLETRATKHPRRDWPTPGFITVEELGSKEAEEQAEKSDISEIEKGKVELVEISSGFAVPYSLRLGLTVLLVFTACFITLMAIREAVKPSPELLQFFANIFLAGTIICGMRTHETRVSNCRRRVAVPVSKA